MLTVPETLAPLAGAVILTADVGVGVAVGVGVIVRVGVGVGAGRKHPARTARDAAIPWAHQLVGVGVGPPLFTVTVTESVPTWVPLLLKARVEIVCEPFETVVEFQLKVNGGDEAK